MKKHIIANWKMNAPNELLPNILAKFAQLSDDARMAILDKNNIVICPPFTAIHHAYQLCQNRGFKIGAQDCHYETQGAYTGDISAGMLKESGAEFVLIGHSERRTYHSETDEICNKKVKRALEIGLIPILCIGETFAQKNNGETIAVLSRQLGQGLLAINLKKIIIAYEPIWAIGTGLSADIQEINHIHQQINAVMNQLNAQTNLQTTILYGGSVNANNAKEYCQSPYINGLLIGGASLKTEEFWQIISQ